MAVAGVGERAEEKRRADLEEDGSNPGVGAGRSRFTGCFPPQHGSFLLLTSTQLPAEIELIELEPGGRFKNMVGFSENRRNLMGFDTVY
jgi:hypothetical protein